METLTYDVDGRIARITLNRPERGNGITLEMPGELAEAVERAEAEMSAFLEHASAADLGEHYGRELHKRREAIREAEVEARRWSSREVSGLVAPVERWTELPLKTRREVARGYIERVVIRKSTRGRWEPMEDRVEVEWLAA